MKRQSRIIGEEEEGESSRGDTSEEAAQGIHSPLLARTIDEEYDAGGGEYS